MPTALGQTRSGGLHDLGVWLWWHVLAAPVAEPVESGAESVVFAALSLTLGPFAYVKHGRATRPAPHAANATAAAWLWEVSEGAVAGVLG